MALERPARGAALSELGEEEREAGPRISEHMHATLAAALPVVRSNSPGCRAAAIIDASGETPLVVDADAQMEEALYARASTHVEDTAAMLAPLLESLPVPASRPSSSARTLAVFPDFIEVRLARSGSPGWVFVSLSDPREVTYGSALAHAERAADALEEQWR